MNIQEISILVVDDEPVIRNLFKDLLGDQGYKVTTVSNGVEAVEAVKRQRYNVAFMDVHMPIMNGLEALIEVIKVQPDINVVMLDSYPDQLLAESEKKGAVTCIHKPFNIKEVIDFIETVSQKKTCS